MGFAGMGTMGAPMAANLARADFALTVWNRTPGRDQAPVALGARQADSPAGLGAGSDVVVLCLTDAPQVDEVLFGRGLADALRAGAVVVDCSTTSPLAAQRVAAALAERGVGFVDAPVTGGSEGAEKGTLTILCGGADHDVAAVSPVLSAMGTTLTHLGPVGAGQWAKAVNQVILAGTYLAVAEGVTLAMKSGLDASAVVAALTRGAAGSWVLENRSARMIADDYPLGFKIELHRKDLGIALELSRALGAVLPVTALAATLEDGLVAEGHGGDDNSALARPIRRLSGL
ncbi:MAG: tartronate semialdehyde reductase [Actinobacteria bacterium 21-73-9]|nr:MAG: tartronate semialdehyde reductase [Actinobacteria bacterium 21-73-9]